MLTLFKIFIGIYQLILMLHTDFVQFSTEFFHFNSNSSSYLQFKLSFTVDLDISHCYLQIQQTFDSQFLCKKNVKLKFD